jgi:hypothetical protein
MAEFVRITHKETLLRLFQALDQRIKNREGQSTVKGFWQSGSMNSLFLPDTSPEAMSVRYMGFWKATASMAQGKVEILSAVLGGNVRIGILLPILFIEKHSGIREAVSCLYDGKPADIERAIGGAMLFDWVFTDAPFSAEWMLRCTHEDAAYDILENHFLWLVIHLLEGLTRALSSCLGSAIPFFGEKFISAEVAESLGLTVIDCFEMQTESGVQCVTLVKAENGELSEATLNKLLAGE